MFTECTVSKQQSTFVPPERFRAYTDTPRVTGTLYRTYEWNGVSKVLEYGGEPCRSRSTRPPSIEGLTEHRRSDRASEPVDVRTRVRGGSRTSQKGHVGCEGSRADEGWTRLLRDEESWVVSGRVPRSRG